jgi:hypothetical protein
MAPDLSRHRIMTPEELRGHVYFAVKLSYGRLPQLKGKGALRDSDARDAALKLFAHAIAEGLLKANAVVLRGPPAGNHTTPRPSEIKNP